jgi:hypothetical protein
LLFPKNRLRYTKTYQAKTDPEGWITLELTALDLEGVNKIYIPFADILNAQNAGDKANSRLEQAKSLLGGDWGTSDEEDNES